jgi:hypothetical protein
MVKSRLENAWPSGQLLRVWWVTAAGSSVETVVRFPRGLASEVVRDLIESIELIVGVVGQLTSEEVRDAGSLYPTDASGGRMSGPLGARGVV